MTTVINVAEEVKQEVVKVAQEVKAEVVKVAEKITQELNAEEKLTIREIENAYLKAQIEIQRLTQITTKAQTDFTKMVEDLAKKYVIDPSVFVFDNVSLIFRKK
jgi:deoxyribodipyrimidine photolyase